MPRKQSILLSFVLILAGLMGVANGSFVSQESEHGQSHSQIESDQFSMSNFAHDQGGHDSDCHEVGQHCCVVCVSFVNTSGSGSQFVPHASMFVLEALDPPHSQSPFQIFHPPRAA